MFNIFESADEGERERVLQARLESMKRARENYFWATQERVPMPEIVADGWGPDDDLVEALRRLQAPPEMKVGPTGCVLTDGDSSDAYPTPEDARRILNAIDRACPECAGFGAPLNDDGNPVGVCPACDGTGVVDDDYTYRNPPGRPKEELPCPHRYRTYPNEDGWATCFRCGERIRE